jgi:hypothetical protein
MAAITGGVMTGRATNIIITTTIIITIITTEAALVRE